MSHRLSLTVSQRAQRRTLNLLDNLQKDSDGMHNVDDAWDAMSVPAPPSPPTPVLSPVHSLSPSEGSSSEGFDFGGGSGRKMKLRKSIAESVGGLSDVEFTPPGSGRRSSGSPGGFSAGGGSPGFSEMDEHSAQFSPGGSSGRMNSLSTPALSTPAPAETPSPIRRVREAKKKLRRAAAETKKRNNEKSRVKRAQLRHEVDDSGGRVDYYEDDQSVGSGAVEQRGVEEGALLKFNPAMQLDVESDGSIRRSKRVKVQPVAYWKNEKVVYKPSQEKSIETVGKTGDTETERDFVFVSSIVGTMQPDEPIKPKRAGGRKKGTWRGGMAVTKFDSSRLDHNLKYLNDDKAIVWDNSCEAYTNVKIVSYQSAMVTTALPIADGRKPGQDTVALAAQAFNVPQASEDIPGWISGHVVVPPEGIKDAEGVGMCSQVFFVGTCQPKSFELAIGAPDEDAFNEETAQRFLLSEGDFFHVPPNNIYRIQNHSSQFQAKLFWTIIRPMANED